jgi:hypothetical protein
MLLKRLVVCLASFLLIYSASHADNGLPQPWIAGLSEPEPVTTPRHVPTIGVKKFINSFTSYQFPNPFPPGQDPLSRLEFPIDQWFLGLQHDYLSQSWSLSLQFWVNVNRESKLKMQDSDWDDDMLPFQKTIFSESQCRMNRGLVFDAGVATAIVDRVRFVRAVMGWRYQNFFFTTHDGYQAVFGDGVVPLPGDGIEFSQTFYQAYFGAKLQGEWNPPLMRGFLPRALIGVQADYAIVTARNEDLHLLRAGYRITTENTIGHCWHLCAGLSLLSGGSFNARFEVDFKRLITHGDHRLSNIAVNFSFSGARVWSDQFSCACFGEFLF